MRAVVSLIAVVFPGIAIFAESTEPTARFEKIAVRMVGAINKREYGAVRQDFAKAMLKAFPAERAQTFFAGLRNELGKIENLGAVRLISSNQAKIPAQFEHGTLDIKLVLDANSRIIGLWFLPHVAEIPVLEKNRTALSLPFKGRWLVMWGGDTKELNHHHDVPNQRFAFDFLGVGEDEKTRKGEGTKNEDYHAFGRDVLAPADGVVSDVITGVRDNVPASMNPYSALGNAVFIQHSKHEVSVIAHLKLGSVRVGRGQKVKRGEVIGLCGNSGNSSEPHIHYHLMNTPVIQDARGIKVYFDKVVLEKHGEKRRERNYSPVKGDIIRPR